MKVEEKSQVKDSIGETDVQVPSEYFPLYKPQPPFMDYSGGHGFVGVLLENRRTGKIQCHLCGKDFDAMFPHLAKKHDMTPKAYKEMTGLNATVPLISSAKIKKHRNSFLNLTPEEQKRKIEQLRAMSAKRKAEGGFKKFRKKSVTVQEQNKSGTCELQTKHEFFAAYRRIGRIPATSEISRGLYSRINDRFESYDDALRQWGFTEKEIGDYKKRNRDNYLEGIELKNGELRAKMAALAMSSIRNFIRANRRLPTWGEFGGNAREGRLPSRNTVLRVLSIRTKDELARIFSSELERYVQE